MLEAFMVAKPDGVADQEHQLLVAHPQNSRLDYRDDFIAMKDGNFEVARSRLKQSIALRPAASIGAESAWSSVASIKAIAGSEEQIRRTITLGRHQPGHQVKSDSGSLDSSYRQVTLLCPDPGCLIG